MAKWTRADDDSIVLLFGKHSGEKLCAVPDSYLRWMEGTFESDPELLEEVQEELRYRDRAGVRIDD